MLLVSFWALSNFVTLVSCFSYSHDRESCTHHPHMLKLPHWKNSTYIPTTHFYPFLCSTLHKVSPRFSPIKVWAVYQKKIWTHEGPWKKNGHMKVHAEIRKLAMPQSIRRERSNLGVPYSLAFHSTHHISTHMNFSIMVVWLVYSLGPIFDFAKYLRQVCLRFFSLSWAPPKNLKK